MAVNQMVSPGGVGPILKIPENMIAKMKEFGIEASISANKKMATFKTKTGVPFSYDFGSWQTGHGYMKAEPAHLSPADKLHQAGLVNTLNKAIQAAQGVTVAVPTVTPPMHKTAAVKSKFIKPGQVGADGMPENFKVPPGVKVAMDLGATPPPKPKASTLAKQIALGGFDPAVVPQTVEEVEQIMMGQKVPLAAATRQYQPVGGSDGGSVYYALAIGPDLKIGARWKGKKMSIRVEGPKLAEAAALIAQAGFGQGSDKHYSVHIAVPDDLMAKRSIAAFMAPLLMSYQFVTPMPSIMLIKDKGV